MLLSVILCGIVRHERSVTFFRLNSNACLLAWDILMTDITLCSPSALFCLESMDRNFKIFHYGEICPCKVFCCTPAKYARLTWITWIIGLPVLHGRLKGHLSKIAFEVLNAIWTGRISPDLRSNSQRQLKVCVFAHHYLVSPLLPNFVLDRKM